jgi:hypothetical protein
MESGNQRIRFVAPNDGTVYVYEKGTARLVWSGLLARGESLDVNPVTNSITDEGSVVANKILSANVEHDIYFKPLPPLVTTPSAPGSVIVTPGATVQPNHGNLPPGSVSVEPSLKVTPAPQPVRPYP